MDLDLEKFFDFVNHDILLDDLDRELAKRGHHFVRYADGADIYVASAKVAHRVLESVTRWLVKRLNLKVNVSQSGVARPCERRFLGYSVTTHRKAKLRASSQSVKRLKGKVRESIR